MLSDSQSNGIGGTTEAAATPVLRWNYRSIDPDLAPLSARKLAASLWRLADTTPAGGSIRWQCADRLGFQFCLPMPIPKFVTEEATKAWDCADYVKPASVLSTSGENVNRGGGARTNMRKMNEVNASSSRTECRSVINNLAEGVKSERKFYKNIDKMNSNLLYDIAETKLSARKLVQHLEKEKKARHKLEDVCYDLAKEIERRKAEIGALRNEQRRMQQEVEEERKMQQMAEVWREEQAQMKLADAKFLLEDKYSKVNEVITDLKTFTRRSNMDVLRQQTFECGVAETSEDEWRNNGRLFRSYNSKRKVLKGFQKSKTCKVSSSSRLQDGNSISSTVSMASPALNVRTNPHVIRAMTGHNQWNLLEAKLGSNKMLLRNVLKQKTVEFE